MAKSTYFIEIWWTFLSKNLPEGQKYEMWEWHYPQLPFLQSVLSGALNMIPISKNDITDTSLAGKKCVHVPKFTKNKKFWHGYK